MSIKALDFDDNNGVIQGLVGKTVEKIKFHNSSIEITTTDDEIFTVSMRVPNITTELTQKIKTKKNGVAI